MKSCGKRFHDEVGKFRFLNELIKVVSPKVGAPSPSSALCRPTGDGLHFLLGLSLLLLPPPPIRTLTGMSRPSLLVPFTPLISRQRLPLTWRLALELLGT